MRHNPLGSGSDEQAGETASTAKTVDFLWGVKILLRDGVHLNATVYRPGQIEPTPVIFTLTPYIADSYHERAYYFAQRGYAFVLVDCRGRGNSEGEFEPFINEGPDGHDVVEWLAEQPWCNSAVTMWGGSYAGFDQWMALKEFPPHLRTIVPAAAAHMGVDFPFLNNMLDPYAFRWLTLTSGVTPNAKLFSDRSFWIEQFRDFTVNHLPFKDLDRVIGNTSTHFQTWMQHPIPDAYWDRMALTPDEYARIDIPILTITGHYDGDQPGAMHYYKLHMRSGSPEGRARHYLIIGPWDHAGTRTPNKEFGGLRFGDASMLDLDRLHVEWYDWTLKGGPKPGFLKNRVAYYLMGADEWKYADSLETISDTTKRLYLGSIDGRANDVFHSGTLDEVPPGHPKPDQYTYDPLDPRAGELEREQIENYLIDQRYELNLSGNGLVYHSAPFAEDTEMTGYAKLVAWIALDVPDTDIQVTVSEVLLNGSHIKLAQDYVRARYRESRRQEKLVTPHEVNRYVFDRFNFFSRWVAKGSRLRLFVSAPTSLILRPNSIYIQRNYNSGGDLAAESGKDARTAHVTLYHDAEHPSFLELPVVI